VEVPRIAQFTQLLPKIGQGAFAICIVTPEHS